MTQSDHFNREELLEHAHLDAHGLLDEVEAERFSKGFAQATPQVQADIVRIQEDAARSFDRLSDETPPESLRLRTIARVMHATEEAARPATIARIGRDRQQATRGSTSREVVETLESMHTDPARRISRSLATPLAQNFWRAATLFFAAALAVTLWFNARGTESIRVLAGAVHSNRMSGEIAHLAELAPGFAGCNFNTATPVFMSATALGGNASGVLFLDAKEGTISLIAFGLKDGATLVLRARDGTNPSHEIGRSVASQGTCAGYFGTVASADFGMTLEITAPNGDVLLQVRPVV